MKFIQYISITLLAIGVLIFLSLTYLSHTDGLTIFTDNKIDYSITGQFGDYVGGVVGTLFTLSGTLLIYLSFKQQNIDSKNTSFESAFFELIKIHRDNVSDLQYRKHNGKESENYNDRQVFRILIDEFTSCYREIKKYLKTEDIDQYLTPKYKKKLTQIINSTKINIHEMVIIDMAYIIFFYGVGEEGVSTIKNLSLRKFNQEHFNKLLYFIKLKPKHRQKDGATRSSHFETWEALIQSPPKKIHEIVDFLYKNRKTKDTSKIENIDCEISNQMVVFSRDKYFKHYGGHQFRLGHYFRHLFITYKYLNSSHLNDESKYTYGKLLRAQMSTYEQALLFINSISSLGMRWEINPDNNSKISNLITRYNIIKNLPGSHILGIRYKTYYPNVSYETSEQVSLI